MEIYIYRNGVQEGPYELDVLRSKNLRPEDLVWCKGMADWEPASKAGATAAFFAAAPVPPVTPVTPVQKPRSYSMPQPGPQEDKPACPPNNLALSIVCLACCCMPAGVYSLIKATQVNSKYTMGDYEGAQESAAEAKKWSIIGIAAGAVFWVVYFIFVVGAQILASGF